MGDGRRGRRVQHSRVREIIHHSPRLAPSLAPLSLSGVSHSTTLSPLIHFLHWFRLQILIGGPILIRAKLPIEMGSHFVTYWEMWIEILELDEIEGWPISDASINQHVVSVPRCESEGRCRILIGNEREREGASEE